ncbi:hypothetical protein DFQ28_005172 [Apophysomyces sp. BC1034]|nr:hypothetical protein DFQ28_005172 [Apophysomyces sp. BC1034]
MSSLHEWIEEITAQHDAQRPFAPENGQPLRFEIGDSVIYTNPAGIEFRNRITGFYRPSSPCGQYAQGARYLIDSDSPWFPVPESRLHLDTSHAQVEHDACTACGAAAPSIIG